MNNDTGTPTPMGVAFQLLDFLTEKFNFTFKIVKPETPKLGSTNDMAGSLLELLKNGVSLLELFATRCHNKFIAILESGNGSCVYAGVGRCPRIH